MPEKILADQLGKGSNFVAIDTDREAGRMLMLWRQGYRVANKELVEAPTPAAVPNVIVTDLTLAEEKKPKRKKGS